MTNTPPLGERLQDHGEPAPDRLKVQISYELIRLLSEQLYSSPAKAIEELIVNAWDADARLCSVYVPSALATPPDDLPDDVIVVFDDGHGMDEEGLRDLWHVGRSRKRDPGHEGRTRRLQIGKFGIGKLATYAIAHRITYITRTEGKLLGVTVDFDVFTSSAETGGEVTPVYVEVIAFDPQRLAEDESFRLVTSAVGQDAGAMASGEVNHWTLVVLENLKEEAGSLSERKLRWVFSTAMPLERDFLLLLNETEVESADEGLEWLVEFDVTELNANRLEYLRTKTEEDWAVIGDALVCDSLPSGVTGRIRVARESLYRPTTKRADLGRSHGFFVRVRGRLVNEDDALFGLKPRSYQVFNRLAASVNADDLDAYLTAPREAIERSEAQVVFQELLYALFADARERYEAIQRAIDDEAKRKKDGHRNYVNANLVEHPIADVLAAAEADGRERWFYLDIEGDDDRITELITTLYTAVEPRRNYIYTYDPLGEDSPLVRFEPETSRFVINEDHPLVIEYIEEEGGRGKELVELVATAEALLEVYLHEAAIPSEVSRPLLERRDSLLRSLSKERVFSPRTLAAALREGQTHDKELEVAVVAAMRLLGFSAEHVSEAANPDGIATYTDGRRRWKITLEAKSTKTRTAPSLAAIDFAGLREHMRNEDAVGCLLVAPAYPGGTKDESAAARRGEDQGISCWTVEDLARLVEAAEHRHIHARDVIDIVTREFAPEDVAAAIEKLVTTPTWTQVELRRAVLDDIVASYARITDAELTVNAIAYSVGRGLPGVTEEEVRAAVIALVEGSRGGLHLSDSKELVYVRTDTDELRRRVTQMTGAKAPPRRRGTLREQDS